MSVPRPSQVGGVHGCADRRREHKVGVLPQTTGFSDVNQEHPHEEAINDLALRGIISGYPDGTFRPNNPVLRQHFAKMITRTLELPVSPADLCPFVDVAASEPGAYVDPSDPHYPDHYIAVCAAHGITKGKTSNTYAPYDEITRQQLITMVVRAAHLPAPPAGYDPPFSAGQFYPEEHYLNARTAAHAGLLGMLRGLGPTYDFTAPATRGEVCVLLFNLLQR
jgi:hypothetical protein